MENKVGIRNWLSFIIVGLIGQFAWTIENMYLNRYLYYLEPGKLDYVSLEDVVGNNKVIGAVEGGTEDSNMKVVKMDDDLIKTARDIGICLGD